MVVYENECVDCGLPCLGDSCLNRHVPHYHCDECGKEFPASELYDAGGGEVCMECAMQNMAEKPVPDDPDERYDLKCKVMEQFKTIA